MTRSICSVLLLLLAATPAYAHSPVPGIEGFYVGLLDPLSAAPQVLTLLSFGLLVGNFDKSRAIGPLATFLGATLAGIVLGASLLTLNMPLLVTAAVTGVVAALAPARFWAFGLAAAAVGGFLVGAVSIPDPGPVRDRIVTVAGSFVGANLAVLYIYGAIFYAKEKSAAPWLPTALRLIAAAVAITALALLAMALGTGA